MGIVTKRGDNGATELATGERVSKNDPRISITGTFDELISLLGLARSLAKSDTSEIRALQVGLMKLFSPLSQLTPNKNEDADLQKELKDIEQKISWIESTLDLPSAFIVPGASPSSAALDTARAVARRLEREIVSFVKDEGDKGDVPPFKNGSVPFIFAYLNRLSDYIFLLARRQEKLEKTPFDTVSLKRSDS